MRLIVLGGLALAGWGLLVGCGSSNDAGGGTATDDDDPVVTESDDDAPDAGCGGECADDASGATDDSRIDVTPDLPVTTTAPGPRPTAFAPLASAPSTTPMTGAGGTTGAGGATGAGGTTGVFAPSAATQLDLLFVIDNSSSMNDKQALLKDTIPDLLDMLVNPPCIGQAQQFVGYPGPDGDCPLGSLRLFDPIDDVHVGIITSSLGPQGALEEETPAGCSDVPEENDRGWLLGRMRTELVSTTHEQWGFLAWDPEQTGQPPGEQDQAQLVANFQAQVTAVGEQGCGYEAPLEAAYRFLIDPDPYETLERVPCSISSFEDDCAEPSGTDEELLAQRSVFLRPNSLLGVVYLTDENDCSLRYNGQGYVATSIRALPNATNACEADPNDECCAPCDVALPGGCETDPALNGCNEPNADLVEARALRCFDQERRFGTTFLRTTAVYAAGFNNAMVADRNGNGRPNPLFTGERKPEDVFVVGIVGVPWQSTATAATRDEPTTLELQGGSELDWSLLLPSGNQPPADPFSRESMAARAGAHPLTGETLGGPGTWNSINGHERNLLPDDGLDDDLQYSCIFELAEPRDCSTNTKCACGVGSLDGVELDYSDGNPVCLDPATQRYGTVQHYARAYPAPRILEVLRGVSCPDDSGTCNDRAVVASICPRQATDPSALDFGYRPAMRALLRAIAKTAAQ